MSSVADICLLLEGTYPFVRGGVSAWIHQLINGLPDLSFSLIFIGGRRRDYPEMRYALPANVTHLETHFLDEALQQHPPKHLSPRPTKFEANLSLHRYLKVRSGREQACPEQLQPLEDSVDAVLGTLEKPGGLCIDDFLFSPCAWEQMRDTHLAGPDTSFVDYFWTLRLMHGPLFQLARIAHRAPPARAYHAISTGYAGFLGALLVRLSGRPLLLSEHGIYTKERRIDLNHAAWLDKTELDSLTSAGVASATLRELWVRLFESLGRLTYRAADPIVSLYQGNRERQHQDGADPARTRVIVNGIDGARFEPALRARTEQVPRVIGLVGRIVPIKDVKTFIRALHLVHCALPDVEGWIIGSSEEDASYGEECTALARSLGLGDKLRFLGHRDVVQILPQLGVLMLTSISEGQPLAILEAFAAGVPCIATDVGACREQIDGRGEDDRALGRAGRVVPFADAKALAHAAIELLSSAEAWKSCQRAGLARVREHYALANMLGAYRDLYRSAIGTES